MQTFYSWIWAHDGSVDYHPLFTSWILKPPCLNGNSSYLYPDFYQRELENKEKSAAQEPLSSLNLILVE